MSTTSQSDKTWSIKMVAQDNESSDFASSAAGTWVMSTTSGNTLPSPWKITYPSATNITTPYVVSTTTWPPLGKVWPDVENPIGVLFVENDKLMMMKDDGQKIEIADLKNQDEDVGVKLMIVVAKKKLEEVR